MSGVSVPAEPSSLPLLFDSPPGSESGCPPINGRQVASDTGDPFQIQLGTRVVDASDHLGFCSVCSSFSRKKMGPTPVNDTTDDY